MVNSTKIYDIIVVGAGHAGVEASLASARMGLAILVITISLDSIARASCNPAIGGIGKGQIVREIDALGGEMAKATDKTGIQFRMLNTSRGPAVQSPRAQIDKYAYSQYMKNVLQSQNNITLVEDIIEEILIEKRRVVGVVGKSGKRYFGRAVILATGTFLKGICYLGEEKFSGGRINEPSAENLSSSLKKIGFEIGRLKTGTPPRILKDSIDFSKVLPQYGDEKPKPFSFQTPSQEIRNKALCWLTWTNSTTHKILRDNFYRAPLYTGRIKSTGPRYCPSIETKILRFANKDRHPVFLEPEGLCPSLADEIYCNGLSTSVPKDVQDEMVHSIAGLSKGKIIRYGYAIEYDFAFPHQLKPTLETKLYENLYFAGQINGTSGYEEAAGQGIVAGINAALKIKGLPPFILSRSESYIGVMIDDLVLKELTEPYRMFTSRAEHRLILRSDNAARRLGKYGTKFGLIAPHITKKFEEKESKIKEVLEYLKKTRLGSNTLSQLLKRPEFDFCKLEEIHPKLKEWALDDDVKEQVEIDLKYEGYIARENAEIARFERLENKLLPADIDYWKITHLRFEAREKLSKFRPISLGKASRIEGVSPSDISVLSVYLKTLQ